MKLSTTRVLGSVVLLALLPVLALQSPTSAATTRPADGMSQATAAGSCWEVKQNNPSAADGIYWLVTPALQAPQQFYCDQTTAGGGWVLVGRGRQGWKPYYQGVGTAAQVRGTVDGPGAFNPAQLTSQTVDGLLNNTAVSGLSDGVRLRRAADRLGTTWQEVRFKMPNRTRWEWTFAAQHPVGTYSFSGAGPLGNGSGGQTVNFGLDSIFRRVNTQAPEAQGFLWGFAYGNGVTGSTDPDSYIWSAVDNAGAGRPFTQMFLRPQLQRDAMFTASVPDAGTPKQEIRALPDSNADRTVWGVSGLADGIDGELHTEVQSFAQIGNTMFVGGNFQNVQRDAAGTGQVAQPDLAAFDDATGEFIPGFKPAFNGQVKALAALPDGRLAVGGEFSTVNGANQPGLALLNPATGALSGAQVRVETRNGAGLPFVRGLDVRNGFLYVAGGFTHLVQGTTAASDWNGGRINLSTTRPDTNWNPVMNGTSVGVNVSPRNDRVYFAGYFSTVHGQTQTTVTALQPVATAPLALPGWQARTSTAVANRQWQLDVQEAGNRFYHGGSQHNLFGYDRDAMNAGTKSGSITLAGGDVQTITANSDTVFAGCHCGDFNYQDAYTYPTPTGFTQADSINTFGAWDAATGVFQPEFNPIVKGRKGYGAWGMMTDTRGTLWVGGDYATSIRAGYVNQWSGGFMRYAPRDNQAPTTPTNLSKTDVDANTFRLSWTASTDNSGSRSYEVIEGNRVIATTTTTSADISRLSGTQRYFVRAVDANGNRSASTNVLTVSDAGNPPPPAAPQATGQATSATSIRLSWPTQAADGGFIIKRDGNQVGTAPSTATQYDDTGLTPATTYTYTVTAVDSFNQQTASDPFQVTTDPLATQTTLVDASAPWRWRYASTAPPATWKDAEFNDTSWALGTGPFGFGTALANTDISVGAPSPRPLGAQFRTTFVVADPAAVGNTTLTFVADDGVVVYLNGTEVRRQNLPAGTISSTGTYANAAPRSSTSNANPVVMTIPASDLATGTNVIAAETHLNFRATPDALFRLTLATP